MNRHALNEVVEFLRKPNTEIALVCAINEVEEDSFWYAAGSYHDVVALISTALIKYAKDVETATKGKTPAEDTLKHFANVTWEAYRDNEEE